MKFLCHMLQPFNSLSLFLSFYLHLFSFSRFRLSSRRSLLLFRSVMLPCPRSPRLSSSLLLFHLSCLSQFKTSVSPPTSNPYIFLLVFLPSFKFSLSLLSRHIFMHRRWNNGLESRTGAPQGRWQGRLRWPWWIVMERFKRTFLKKLGYQWAKWKHSLVANSMQKRMLSTITGGH